MAFAPGTTVKHKNLRFRGTVVSAQINRSELYEAGIDHMDMRATLVADEDTGEIRLFLDTALEVVAET
jgi:hypothetical protein